MFVQPIDYFLAAWFVLAFASTVYVGVDQYRNNPEPAVMKWGFILVTLYMGPIGLLLYVMADKEPRPGEHETFVRPLWKQGVGSTIHCVAGDATGIILAAVVTAALGLPMWLDLIVEYCAGFAFGLFIFQSLFMKSMMGGSYPENVRRSFIPEFISMNFMMAGMAPVMSFLMMGRDMRAMVPTELVFWGVMSTGVIAGFVMAYPWNVWLVSQALKHGLMTERKPGTKFDSEASAGHAAHSKKAGDKTERTQQQPSRSRRSCHGHSGDGRAARGGRRSVAAGPGVGHGRSRELGEPQSFGTRRRRGDHAAWHDHGPRYAGGCDARHGRRRSPPGDSSLRPGGARRTRPRAANGEWGQGLHPDDFGVPLDDPAWRYRRRIWGFNGQIPGPTIRFDEGDRVRNDVVNQLPETTTVHWHGLILPNVMDGPAMITQAPIPNGKLYHYEFTALQSGTYLYHSHDHVDRQQALGLYGALIIDPKTPDPSLAANHEYVLEIQEWLKREGLTYPAMPMDGGQPNFFTFNGKAYPATDTVHMKVGETLKVRMLGSNNGFIHPIHIHGGPFEVVAIDGQTLAPSARFMADTVNIGPGQRYDVIWKALTPGKWLIHCHIGHHTTNNNVETNGGGGLMMVIDVRA